MFLQYREHTDDVAPAQGAQSYVQSWLARRKAGMSNAADRRNVATERSWPRMTRAQAE
jgi:hypothetical protein